MWPGGQGVLVMHTDFKIWDLPKSHHVDNAGVSPVLAKTFTGYHADYIQAKFPINCCVAQ